MVVKIRDDVSKAHSLGLNRQSVLFSLETCVFAKASCLHGFHQILRAHNRLDLLPYYAQGTELMLAVKEQAAPAEAGGSVRIKCSLLCAFS